VTASVMVSIGLVMVALIVEVVIDTPYLQVALDGHHYTW